MTAERDARQVKRYEISLTAGEVRESPNGYWMHATDYDALVAENEKLRAQFDQHRADTGLDAHRLISEKMAAYEQRDILVAENERLRELLKHFTVRPSFHHDCDDYSRGYGDALAVVATQATNALTSKAST